MIFWNIGNYLPVDSVQHPTILEYSRTSSKWHVCFIILLFNNKYTILQFFSVKDWENGLTLVNQPMLWDTSGTNEWIAESQPI
jgi:hypothetical protein